MVVDCSCSPYIHTVNKVNQVIGGWLRVSERQKMYLKTSLTAGNVIKKSGCWVFVLLNELYNTWLHRLSNVCCTRKRKNLWKSFLKHFTLCLSVFTGRFRDGGKVVFWIFDIMSRQILLCENVLIKHRW